ncbi:LysR family transcriptional regulator [Ramlibacter sp.]|uniref:LysR family transcriptional regulator n=1 Tax=Ramlibacter sp. TaxID=1917967 RepID=UPI003D1306BC
MNIKYRQLKAFSLAAQTQSFTRAADAMAVTQASFSTLIKELEHDLGVVLFERTTRRCTLTDAGRVLADTLRSPLEHLESVYAHMKEIGAGKRGRLVVAALPSMSFDLVPRVLAGFRAALPGVEVVLRERMNEEVFDAVKAREAELGLGCLLRPDPELEWVPLGSDQLLAIVPAHHALAGPGVTWRQLENFPMIMMGRGSAERALLASNLRLKAAFDVEYVATAVAMVREGLGITTLPSSLIGGLNMQGLKTVPIAGALAKRALGVAYRKGSHLSSIAAAFVEQLANPAARRASKTRDAMQ